MFCPGLLSLGLGLEAKKSGLGLGLGLERSGLGLGLGLERSGLGLGLGLERSGLGLDLETRDQNRDQTQITTDTIEPINQSYLSISITIN